ncbi:MAG: MFS transporter [Spirochaetales bacterium]|nr:MFS transporter [Spirochaetales bacterium]
MDMTAGRDSSSRIKMIGLMGFYLAYFLSYFIKLSPSIIMPVLQARFNFTSGQTGFISSMYFLPYATMQLFVGPLCRKFGAGPLTGAGMIIGAAGLLIFSNGTTIATLALGRFLLGLGTSPVFIGMIYYMRDCFEGDRYARYYGFGIFVSSIGSIVAAAPLKALLEVVPSETVFISIAVMTFVLGAFMIFIDRRRRVAQESGQNLLASIGKDVRITFTSRMLVAGLMLWLIEAPSLVCYQGLWCTKWTATAFPAHESLSGLSGIAISIGTIIASTIGENWVNAYKKKTGRTLGQTIIRICLLHILATMLLSFSKQADNMPMFCCSMLCDVFFGFTTGSIIVQGGVYVKEHTTAKDNASVMGVYNFIGCISQQLSQWLTGVEIDLLVVTTGLNMAFCLTFSTMAIIFCFLTVISKALMRKRD